MSEAIKQFDLNSMTVLSRDVLVERLKGRVERMKADMRLVDMILEIVPSTGADLPAEAVKALAKAKEARETSIESIGEMLSVLHWLQREPS